jgi:glycosyltransferase involved in cell wall biosynthesis
VVIPTYNRAGLIGRSVQSVLGQTFGDFELIVVDDCSADSTEEVVRGFRDGRIKYVRHGENRGGSAARNTGIRLARGRYVAFQDSDDEWMPEKLKKQVEALRGSPPDICAVYTGFWKVDGGGRTYIPPEHVRKEGDILGDLLRENYVSTQCLMARKECLEGVGLFDEAMPRLQDWELAIRLAERYRFRCVDEPLVNVYGQGDSISARPDTFYEAQVMLLRKHEATYREKAPGALAKHLYDAGTHLYRRGDTARGLDLIKESLRTRPLSPARWPTFLITRVLGRAAYLRLYSLLRKRTGEN